MEMGEKVRNLETKVALWKELSERILRFFGRALEERNEARAWARRLYAENKKLKAENDRLQLKIKTAAHTIRNMAPLDYYLCNYKKGTSISYMSLNTKWILDVAEFLEGHHEH